MKLLIIVCLVGVALSIPRPSFRYAYMIPQTGQVQPWSQFNERADENYAWGYEFPGRSHFESKDELGVVKGSFGYVDPEGRPIVWQYSSHPNTGFNVNTGIGSGQPQAPEAVSSGYSTRNEDPSPFNLPNLPRSQVVENFASPLLKQAAFNNEIIPAGNSPSGTPQYAVNPLVAEGAGGISALAERLGAIPVAAVHDVQSRPTFGVRNSAFSPVLVHREKPDVTLYTIEVPIQ